MVLTSLTKKLMAALGAIALTTLAAGSAVEAATLQQTETFLLECAENSEGNCVADDSLSFDDFDSVLGTLTSVTLDLDSSFFGSDAMEGTISLNGTEVSSGTGAFFAPYTFSGLDLGTPFGLATFIDVGTIQFDLAFDAGMTFFADWGGIDAFGALTLTYEYDEAPTGVVPLPASMGFLAFAMMGFGLAANRRKAL